MNPIFRIDVRECKFTGSVCAFGNTKVVLPRYRLVLPEFGYLEKAICRACIYGHLADDVDFLLKRQKFGIGVADDDYTVILIEEDQDIEEEEEE